MSASGNSISPEDTSVLVRSTGLDLPEDRLDALVDSYNRFRQEMRNVRLVDIGSLEPPTLSFADWMNNEPDR